jgi:hypothetical protein
MHAKPYYLSIEKYSLANIEKARLGEETFREALSDFPILANIPYGKRQKDIDHLVFTSSSVVMNECKNTKESFYIFYSWFMDHVVDRFADGLPIAEWYAKTSSYSTKRIVFALTISRFNAEPIVKASMNGLKINLIETGKQLLNDESKKDWYVPVRDQFLSVINNITNNQVDHIKYIARRKLRSWNFKAKEKANIDFGILFSGLFQEVRATE